MMSVPTAMAVNPTALKALDLSRSFNQTKTVNMKTDEVHTAMCNTVTQMIV